MWKWRSRDVFCIVAMFHKTSNSEKYSKIPFYKDRDYILFVLKSMSVNAKIA